MKDIAELIRLRMIIDQTFKGGEGSGNFGHAGRPGEVGGSATGNIITGSQRDKNFRSWFGNSKVVDDNGNPLVVYHGTPRGGFTEFSPEKRGSHTNSPDAISGYYFTDSPTIANTYSESYRINAANQFYQEVGRLPGRYQGENPTSYPVYLRIENPMIVEMGQSSNFIAITPARIKDAIASGNDGIIARFNDGTSEYLVFESNQIKSTFNQGTFDLDNPNILKESKQ